MVDKAVCIPHRNPLVGYCHDEFRGGEDGERRNAQLRVDINGKQSDL